MKADLAIIGGGPGGYVAAIRGAQLKKRVVLIERENVGGVCMNWGCIPTKHLLEATKSIEQIRKSKYFETPVGSFRLNWEKVLEEKDSVVERLVNGTGFLLKKNGVEVINGDASLQKDGKIRIESNGTETSLEADSIILATGSRPAELPFLKINGKEVITSRNALEMEQIPESLIIVGAGAIGLEMGTIYHRLGAKVTVLEVLPGVIPGCDRELGNRLERLLKRQGLCIHTRMSIENAELEDGKVTLSGKALKGQKAFRFESEKVLLAVGRKPNSECFKDFDSRLELDSRGFVKVNANLETGLPSVYAIGDVIGGKLLAHKASHEGIIAAENASGLNKKMSYHALPHAVFTDPEFASVGLTQQEAEERQLPFLKGMFSLQANGRALTMGKPDGIVKVIADEKGIIIGAHILAPGASELIGELTLAVEKGMPVEDVSSTIHIHPTLSESSMEACLNVRKCSIHMLNQ